MSHAEPQVLEHGGSSLAVYLDAPSWQGKRTAALGSLNIVAHDDGAELIREAIQHLRSEGFEALIGPMDGDTWRAYRSVTQSDGSPPFLMEPTGGEHDVAVLEATGFAPISGYVSARVETEKAIGDKRGSRVGLEILTWDGQSPESFFGEVYDFSVAGFARNRFYKPITREEFLGMYTPYVPFLKRELILFARRTKEGQKEGNLVGFLFGIPNYAEGPGTRTAILKTYASSVFGAGHLLADIFHRNALEQGYTTTIHALMHEDNIALQRSRKLGGEIFRRYALFGRAL